VEYPALPSAVDCGGGVGFIPRLKARVFSLRFINTLYPPLRGHIALGVAASLLLLVIYAVQRLQD